MQLGKYLHINEINKKEFARQLNISNETLRRYIKRLSIPRKKIMVKIVKMTSGIVQPQDFYDMRKDNA